MYSGRLRWIWILFDWWSCEVRLTECILENQFSMENATRGQTCASAIDRAFRILDPTSSGSYPYSTYLFDKLWRLLTSFISHDSQLVRPLSTFLFRFLSTLQPPNRFSHALLPLNWSSPHLWKKQFGTAEKFPALVRRAYGLYLRHPWMLQLLSASPEVIPQKSKWSQWIWNSRRMVPLRCIFAHGTTLGRSTMLDNVLMSIFLVRSNTDDSR